MEAVFFTWVLGFAAFLIGAAWADEGARDAVYLSVIWPLVVVLVVLLVATFVVADLFGWSFNVAHGGPWGTRKPSGDNWPGIALRCPWFELQLWKTRP